MKNKLIYIVIFIMLFSFILSSNCFALELTVLPQGLQDAINAKADSETYDDYFLEANYYIIFQNSNYETTLYFSKSEISCYDSTGTDQAITWGNKYYITMTSDVVYSISFKSGNNGDSYYWYTTSSVSSSSSKLSLDADSYNIIQSNFDVYDSKTGELLYSSTPQEEPPIDDNPIVDENTLIDINTIHTDLGVICSILIFFVLVIILQYAYKFFNMFFTI